MRETLSKGPASHQHDEGSCVGRMGRCWEHIKEGLDSMLLSSGQPEKEI